MVASLGLPVRGVIWSCEFLRICVLSKPEKIEYLLPLKQKKRLLINMLYHKDF